MSRGSHALGVYGPPQLIELLEPYADHLRLFPACRACCTAWFRLEQVMLQVVRAGADGRLETTRKEVSRWVAEGEQQELPSLLGVPLQEQGPVLNELVQLVLRRAGRR